MTHPTDVVLGGQENDMALNRQYSELPVAQDNAAVTT
jgi:hypothetical protein